jgi:hypothetical protein
MFSSWIVKNLRSKDLGESFASLYGEIMAPVVDLFLSAKPFSELES